MSEQYSLRVQKRDSTGKGSMRKLRSRGYLPGVYYSKEGENFLLQMSYGTFQRVYESAQKSNIINLELPGESAKKPALVWDVQTQPVKEQFLHVDFLGVDLKEEMHVEAIVEVTGTARGEERGGMVNLYRDRISVTCLPGNIPDSIVVDVSELDINEHIYVNELNMPEGVKLKDIYEEDLAMVGVTPPATEESEEEAGEEPSDEEE